MGRDRRAKIIGGFGIGVRIAGFITLGFAALDAGLMIFTSFPGSHWVIVGEALRGASVLIVGQAFIEIRRLMTDDPS